jgi:hypothetical protein
MACQLLMMKLMMPEVDEAVAVDVREFIPFA